MEAPAPEPFFYMFLTMGQRGQKTLATCRQVPRESGIGRTNRAFSSATLALFLRFWPTARTLGYKSFLLGSLSVFFTMNSGGEVQNVRTGVM